MSDPAVPACRLEEVDPRDPRAIECLQGYYAELAARFERGFDPAAGPDPEAQSMRPPLGAFLLALREDEPLACCALCGDGGPTGEVKRLWVAPGARGQGMARRLMAELEGIARARGMRMLRLDTSRHLPEARALYLALGYREIGAYNANPYADHWFEKALREELS